MYTLPNDGYMGRFPEIDAEAFVAPGAVVLGDVKIAKYASLWPGAVVRGDVSYIRIGEASNVQDVACLHVADEGPCIIGDYVTIGHGAIVARQGECGHPAELARRRRAGRGEEADQPRRGHPCAGGQVQDGLGTWLRRRAAYRRRALSRRADCLRCG